MLEASRRQILEGLSEDDVVLDIGGWARPFERANWVMDYKPHKTRGLYGSESLRGERFGPDTWVQRDICDHEPYPFADASIDFVICSHTLEDVRDPIWVCSEMNRIAMGGYIEIPSRLEEQTWGIVGPWAGWSHHRWLIDVVDTQIEFVHKPGILHGDRGLRFPGWFKELLSEEERVNCLWWDGGFQFGERVFEDHESFDRYLREFRVRHMVAREPLRAVRARAVARHLASRLKTPLRGRDRVSERPPA